MSSLWSILADHMGRKNTQRLENLQRKQQLEKAEASRPIQDSALKAALSVIGFEYEREILSWSNFKVIAVTRIRYSTTRTSFKVLNKSSGITYTFERYQEVVRYIKESS